MSFVLSASEDWAHWGLTGPAAFNNKVTGGDKISNKTDIGTVTQFTNSDSSYHWLGDGDPTLTEFGTNNVVQAAAVDEGFSFTVAVDTVEKFLFAFLGAKNARGVLEVTLSDGSAPVQTILINETAGVHATSLIKLKIKADTAGQTATLKYTMGENFGSGIVTLGAVQYSATSIPIVTHGVAPSWRTLAFPGHGRSVDFPPFERTLNFPS